MDAIKARQHSFFNPVMPIKLIAHFVVSELQREGGDIWSAGSIHSFSSHAARLQACSGGDVVQAADEREGAETLCAGAWCLKCECVSRIAH